MPCTFIFPCIMTMISNFAIFFIFKYLFSNFSLHTLLIFAFSYNSSYAFVNNFIFFFSKLIFFIAFSLKNSLNLFMQSLSLYTSCLFSVLLNKGFIDIEKSDGIWSLTFAVDKFSGSFLH